MTRGGKTKEGYVVVVVVVFVVVVFKEGEVKGWRLLGRN